MISLALSRKLKGVKFVRNIYIIPNMISTAAMGVIFLQLYNPSYGIINPIIRLFNKDFTDNILLLKGPAFIAMTCAMPQESVEILKEVGKWMAKNKESIYGCGISELAKPDWGRYTQKGNVIYAHVYEAPLGALPLYGIKPDKLVEVTYLADGSEVNRGEAWNTVLYPDIAFVSFGEDPVFTYPLPDEKDTVLKIRIKIRIK